MNKIIELSDYRDTIECDWCEIQVPIAKIFIDDDSDSVICEQCYNLTRKEKKDGRSERIGHDQSFN